jgi:hypothetical protein
VPFLRTPGYAENMLSDGSPLMAFSNMVHSALSVFLCSLVFLSIKIPCGLYNTNVNYYYIKNGKKYNRFSFRKDVLISKGFDKSKTEACLMKELGYTRIYDCGSMKYEWKSTQYLNESKLI